MYPILQDEFFVKESEKTSGVKHLFGKLFGRHDMVLDDAVHHYGDCLPSSFEDVYEKSKQGDSVFREFGD